MSESSIISLLEKFTSVAIIPTVVGAGLAGWAGIAINDAHNAQWKAYVDWKNTVITNEVVTNFFNKELTDMQRKQREAHATSQEQWVTFTARQDIEASLKAQLDSSDTYRHYQDAVGLPNGLLGLWIALAIGAVAFVGGVWRLFYLEQEDLRHKRQQRENENSWGVS